MNASDTKQRVTTPDSQCLENLIPTDNATAFKRRSLVHSIVSAVNKVDANKCKSIKPIPLLIKAWLSRQTKASSWLASVTRGKLFHKSINSARLLSDPGTISHYGDQT